MRLEDKALGPVMAALIVGLLALSGGAGADEAGDRVLAKMDARLTSASDQFFAYEMLTKVPGRPVTSSSFEVTIKGDKKRRLDFKSPGDIKGMRVLILSLDEMYVYLPAFRKVRRVASHVRDQGFMGSSFSHDDMSVVTYADKMTAVLKAEDETSWTIEAQRRPESTYRYKKLLMRIRKDVIQPEAIEYFNDKDERVKSEKREDYECHGVHCNPKVITLVDHTRGEVTSTLRRKAWKVDTGVADRFFSVRALQRRR